MIARIWALHRSLLIIRRIRLWNAGNSTRVQWVQLLFIYIGLTSIIFEDTELLDWKKYREEYLHEFFFLEGYRGFCKERCTTCSANSQNEPLYRCCDCFIGQPICKSCCLSAHLQQPLHVIEVSRFFLSRFFFSVLIIWLQEWNGEFFNRTLLKVLGLWVQLGHPIGVKCINPQPVLKRVFVLHLSGIHEIAVDYCNCDEKGNAGNWRTQCLWREWMPATHKNPETCCTFCLMEVFHLQNLQAKTSAYDFYTTLAKLSDNTGTHALPVSHNSLCL